MLSSIMSRVDPDDTEEGANVDTMQLSTPPRHARSQHSASVTDASVTMQGGHFGIHILTPVRNQLARVRDRDDDPHFDCEETVNGVTMYMYK
jgi:hypothetical protein